MTRLENDLLRVNWDVKTLLTHSLWLLPYFPHLNV